jgi:biopolymer transport protein ExbD
MGMSTGGGGQAVKAEPNVTPMIDVMLVLLIIFMIIIPTLLAGFNAVPPQGVNLKTHPEEDGDQLLGIDAAGQYYLNKQPIRNQELAARLKQIYDARTTDKIIYLKAHSKLQYDKVLEAIDIASHNGVRVTGLISEQRAGTESTVPGDLGSGARGPEMPGSKPTTPKKK